MTFAFAKETRIGAFNTARTSQVCGSAKALDARPPADTPYGNLPTPTHPSPPALYFPHKKVLHHVGETWICFIRIMVQDPFDDQLDIRVIHDREEVRPAAMYTHLFRRRQLVW